MEERVVGPVVKFSPPSPVMALGKVSAAPEMGERPKITPEASVMGPVNVRVPVPLVATLYPVTLKFKAATVSLALNVTVPAVP